MVATAACAQTKVPEKPRDETTSTVHISEAPGTTAAPDPVAVDTTVTTISEAEPSVTQQPAAPPGEPTTTTAAVEEVVAPPTTTRTVEGAGGSTAVASWYGYELAGNSTANGEVFDPRAYTFAHLSMAFGTLVEFCGSQGCVVARCNDRGPYAGGRSFDLSMATFAAIEALGAGVARVTWRYV